MKSHLEYTAGDYLQEADERGVRPISNIDCQIITGLIQVLTSQKANSNIIALLDKWKAEPDEVVLKLLNNLSKGKSSDLDSAAEDFSELESLILAFVRIKDFTFKVVNIYSIGKEDTYIDNRPIYYIVINKGPLPAKDAWYENTKIPCYSEKERNNLIKELENKLLQFNLCKFI